MAESAPSPRRAALHWAGVGAAYLVLALVVTWPLALHLGDALVGAPTTDQADTAWLRLAVARALAGGSVWTEVVFAPTGYPLTAVVPNAVDHLLGAPLALALPFPLSDNLWWLGVLAANGVAGHVLGWRVGGSHGAGFLCGAAFALSEPVLREAGQGHAPQALALWGPLYLVALVAGLEGRRRALVAAGALLALGALTYWFHAAFFLVATAPLLAEHAWRTRSPRPTLVVLGVAAVLVAVPLAVAVSGSDGLAGLDAAEIALSRGASPDGPIPLDHWWNTHRGADALWPLRAGPPSSSNRLSLVLLGAAVLGWRALGWRGAWPWALAALLGGLLLMGPFLRVGEQPLLVAGWPVPLPGWALAEVFPPAGRLHWPERWGLVVALALLPLAARVRRPSLWAGALVLEVLLLSANAPLPSRDLAAMAGWRSLGVSDGAVLVLPVVDGGEAADDVRSQRALALRLARRPLANVMNLPPAARPPAEFRDWQSRQPLVGWARAHCAGTPMPVPPGAAAALAGEGIGAVAVDVTPGGAANLRESLALRRALEQSLGPPVDYGSALVWWTRPPVGAPAPPADPDGWRADLPRGEGPRFAPPLCAPPGRGP